MYNNDNKEKIENSIFFRRKHKIFVKNDNDINQFYKLHIEKAIENSKYLTSSKYVVSVKKCQLLYCVLTINNEIDIEFENGKLLNKDSLKDANLVEHLTKIIENETKTIRNKLNLVLTINENILSLGYCMDIELVKNIVFYNKKELYQFNTFLPSQIKSFVKGLDNKYNPPFPNFPEQHIDPEFFYYYYCKWLYCLEHASVEAIAISKFDSSVIPQSYKLIFEKDGIKSKSLYQFLFTHFFRDDLKFTIVSLGEKSEYYQVMTDIMSSPSSFTSDDISDLRYFMKFQEDYVKYIPEIVPNKNNLANITKLLFERDSNLSRVDLILPKYGKPEVRDVLDLILILTGKTLYMDPTFNRIDYYERDDPDLILYPELRNEREQLNKYTKFNDIFFNRCNKIIMYKKEKNMLNNYFKRNLEKALKDDTYIMASKKYSLTVKQCNFINCILTLNNSTEIEFENAKCVGGAEAIIDDVYMEKVKDIIRKETEVIKEKLKYPLILTENIAKLGFNLSPELVQIISFYDDYEIRELGEYLMNEIQNKIDSKTKLDYEPKLIDFTHKEENDNDINLFDSDSDDSLEILSYIDSDSDDSSEILYNDNDSDDEEEDELAYTQDEDNIKNVEPFYYHYCKWLYYVEKAMKTTSEETCDLNILSSYKVNPKMIKKLEGEGKMDNIHWHIVFDSNEKEFYEMIQNLITSAEPYTNKDIYHIESFMRVDKDHFDYIPKEIDNKDNLARMINVVYYVHKNDQDFPIDTILPFFHKVNEVLRFIICLSGFSTPELGTVQSFNRLFNENQQDIIFKLLDHCDSTTRYDEFMQYKGIWSRFCQCINHQQLKKKYKEIVADLLSVSKDQLFLSILFKRRNKLYFEKKNGLDLDTLYQSKLEAALQNDKHFSPTTSPFTIQVKKCHLLNCVLILNDHQELEFENGKLMTPPPSILTETTIEIETATTAPSISPKENTENGLNEGTTDEISQDSDKSVSNTVSPKKEESLMEYLEELVEIETKDIRNKLNLVLSLNENIHSYGYIMDIDIVKIIALYTPYELEEISFFISNKFRDISFLPFPKFPNMHLDLNRAFYASYCKWLYRLERIFHYDDHAIPMTFKKVLFKSEKKDEKEKEKEGKEEEEIGDADIDDMEDETEENNEEEGDPKKIEKEKEDKEMKRKRIKYEMDIDSNDKELKLIALGEKKELCEIITNIINSPEACSPGDLFQLKQFIQFEKDHLKYIPESIPNKENLANIVNVLYEYYQKNLPEETIIPLFKTVNDVLRFALVLSGHSAADLGKPQRFKSFTNYERKLLMKLLNNCGGDRYDDLLKYHDIWSRLFERIHPMAYKKHYPDLIEDLLGTYRFIGEPNNKQLRMEFFFYQMLLKLDDRISKYREDSIRLIQHKKPVQNESYYFNNCSLGNVQLRNRNIELEPLLDLEFLDKEDYNTINSDSLEEKEIKNIIAIIKNQDIGRVLEGRDYPLKEKEYSKILEKFKSLKLVPETLHQYLYTYLMKLIFIFRDGLKKTNKFYQKSWSYNSNEAYHLEIFQAIKDSSVSVYRRILPILDTELIQKRMKEIQPKLSQLSDQVYAYKRERQPFNSKWVELIRDRKIEEAAKLLSRKPGIFLRQLDELITKSEESQYDLLLKLFEKVSNKVSVKVLLTVKGYFQKRSETLNGRAFLIQGSIENKKNTTNYYRRGGRSRIININRGVETKTRTTIYYTTKVKMPLAEKTCQQIVHICDESLKTKFETKPKLAKVYICPELKKFIIPYDLRQEKKTSENYSKGTRFDVTFKGITEEVREMLIENLEKKLAKNQKKEKEFTEKKHKYEIKYINSSNGLYPGKMTKTLKALEKKQDILRKIVKKNEQELENLKNYEMDTTYNYIRLYVIGYGDFVLEMYDEDLQIKSIFPTLRKFEDVDTYGRGGRGRRRGMSYPIDDDNVKKPYIFCCYESDRKFYDIDFEKIVQDGVRYIMINIDSGNNIKFGWMERRALNSSEKFKPETYHQNFSFEYDKNACPLILDCKTREFIWLDQTMPYQYFDNFRRYKEHLEKIKKIIKDADSDSDNDSDSLFSDLFDDSSKIIKNRKINKKVYEGNLKFKQSLLYFYLNPMKISISDLIQLHVQARGGTLVESEDELQEGDLAFFSTTPYFTKKNVDYVVVCQQLETILSNYMS
ncbi:hypothetical protein PIROE2DRAFT_10694 [Piromyces sp. E2]|nr:hypothetical protein PIROE2DRAFT_10694 [Piromyces sp. E2]|eukprot:OUM62893.1 hypothetical protein PIROE2DRAFT_10694 [Piromyces sp. E2]